MLTAHHRPQPAYRDGFQGVRRRLAPARQLRRKYSNVPCGCSTTRPQLPARRLSNTLYASRDLCSSMPDTRCPGYICAP